jgi:Tol biopolymer transport system component/tRNA A-37 threonylcarbamoyl transferase component Bud32
MPDDAQQEMTDADGSLRQGTLETLRAGLAATYIVEREIGVGGMATVYLAQDRKHDRRVAIKVLRPELGADVGAERFLAEIRVTAGLQHPNLLPLFDSGEVSTLLYYVMPLVAGESLRAKLDRERQMPVDDAVRLTVKLAGALDYAHRHGVIHRDLKPENILLQDGEPLIADFGIALAVSHIGAKRLTATGLSLGTPTYMSPEQAAADSVLDARSDQYALACVLYEMLSGEPPHIARSVQAMIARILTEPPRSIRAMRPSVPAHVDDALQRALAKVPADRFASMREFGEALSARALPMAAVGHGKEKTSRRTVTGAALAFVAMVACVGAGWLFMHRDSGVRAKTARFVISALTDSPREGAPTITPDGQSLVYIGPASTKRQIFVRGIDELTARPLAGTDGALSVFVSPDGRRIGFLTIEDKLKVVPITGGQIETLTSVFRFANARWVPGGTMILAVPGEQWRGLVRLADSGGVMTRLTVVDTSRGEAYHAAPLLLPDGRTIVFTIVRQRGGPGTLIGQLASAPFGARDTTPRPHQLIGVEARQAVALVDDWLVYVAAEGKSLHAVRFDHSSGRASGTPVVVLQDTAGVIEGVSLTNSGTLLYSRRRTTNVPMLVDATGAAQPLLGAPEGSFMNPRLSPDGRSLVIQSLSAHGNDVAVYDIASRTPTPLTSTGNAQLPSWTPDGQSVVYWRQAPEPAYWRQRADGKTPAEQIISVSGGLSSTVTADGRSLIFERRTASSWGIWTASIDERGDRTPRAIVNDRFDNYMPAMSPDGNWLAYASNASGRYEVYVRPFPGPGAAVQISDIGAIEPVWSKDGRGLYYRAGQRLVSAALAFSPRLVVASRQLMFGDAFDSDMPHANYDVTRDGKAFVMIGGAVTGSEAVVTLDWLSELRAKLAAAQRP